MYQQLRVPALQAVPSRNPLARVGDQAKPPQDGSRRGYSHIGMEMTFFHLALGYIFIITYEVVFQSWRSTKRFGWITLDPR